MHAQTSIPHKLRRLRDIIGQRSRIGFELRLDEREIAPLIDAQDDREVRFYLLHLQHAGEVTVRTEPIPSHQRTSSTSEFVHVQLQVAGWQSLFPSGGVGVAGTCFVAMAFHPSLDDAYENGFVRAIRDDCGFEVIRIDRVHHNDDITDRILAGLRTAQFVVADFTKQRPGVYFEAGFAAGLGRTVIWTCHAKDFGRLHFDTRQRNHIKWNKAQDLREQLTARIRATVTLPVKFR